MKLICNILIIWFLVIQSLGVDGRAIAAIPMETKEYCEAAIPTLKVIYGWVNPRYNCVDAGSVATRI